jgi:collagenase-like PrtC family protease
MLLRSQDEKNFLAMNGIQTQSAGSCNLLGAVPEMQRMGVELLRLSPQSRGMDRIVALFRQVIDGEIDTAEAMALSEKLAVGETCNGYWYGEAGMLQVNEA